jgi:hypothetical protein
MKLAAQRVTLLLGSLAVVGFALAAAIGFAGAQAPAPTPGRVLLTGAITSPSGIELTNARVLVHWDDTGVPGRLKTNIGIPDDRVVKTDTHGNYYSRLPPGFYDLFVTAPGMSPYCRKVRLKPSEDQTVNVSLPGNPLIMAELGPSPPK